MGDELMEREARMNVVLDSLDTWLDALDADDEAAEAVAWVAWNAAYGELPERDRRSLVMHLNHQVRNSLAGRCVRPRLG